MHCLLVAAPCCEQEIQRALTGFQHWLAIEIVNGKETQWTGDLQGNLGPKGAVLSDSAMDLGSNMPFKFALHSCDDSICTELEPPLPCLQERFIQRLDSVFGKGTSRRRRNLLAKKFRDFDEWLG